MKNLRLYTLLTMTAFATSPLYSEEEAKPPIVQEAPLEEGASNQEEMADQQLTSTKVDEKLDEGEIDASERDQRTDMFMRGAFTLLSALLFLAGYFSVKTNQGKRV